MALTLNREKNWHPQVALDVCQFFLYGVDKECL